MVIEKRKKNGMISYETEYLRKVQGGYKFLGTLDVKAENIAGTAIIVWHIKGTEDYYLSGVKMSENAADSVNIRDSLGTKFVQKVSDGGHYKEIVIYDYEYYGYMYDITEDYEIYLDGQTHILPSESKYSVR